MQAAIRRELLPGRQVSVTSTTILKWVPVIKACTKMVKAVALSDSGLAIIFQ